MFLKYPSAFKSVLSVLTQQEEARETIALLDKHADLGMLDEHDLDLAQEEFARLEKKLQERKERLLLEGMPAIVLDTAMEVYHYNCRTAVLLSMDQRKLLKPKSLRESMFAKQQLMQQALAETIQQLGEAYDGKLEG